MSSNTLCTNVHTDLRNRQRSGTIVSYDVSAVPCTASSAGLMQCEQTINRLETNSPSMLGSVSRVGRCKQCSTCICNHSCRSLSRSICTDGRTCSVEGTDIYFQTYKLEHCNGLPTPKPGKKRKRERRYSRTIQLKWVQVVLSLPLWCVYTARHRDRNREINK